MQLETIFLTSGKWSASMTGTILLTSTKWSANVKVVVMVFAKFIGFFLKKSRDCRGGGVNVYAAIRGVGGGAGHEFDVA